MTVPEITLSAIETAIGTLSPWFAKRLHGSGGTSAERLFPTGTAAVLKLELFQYAGSFKARGALCVMLALDPEARRRGVTAVSAGNHAIAVAWGARTLGTTAKVVMPNTADPYRVEPPPARCRS